MFFSLIQHCVPCTTNGMAITKRTLLSDIQINAFYLGGEPDSGNAGFKTMSRRCGIKGHFREHLSFVPVMIVMEATQNIWNQNLQDSLKPGENGECRLR